MDEEVKKEEQETRPRDTISAEAKPEERKQVQEESLKQKADGGNKKEKKDESILLTKAKHFINNLDIYDKLLILLIFIVICLQVSQFNDMQQIPGPLYGGDLYRERGFSQHILNGEAFWEDPYIDGEYAFYPQLGYITAAGITTVTGISLDQVLIYFPVAIAIFVGIGVYLLGNILFNNKLLALLLVALEYSSTFIIGKHTWGMGYVFALFFMYCFVKIYKSEDNETEFFRRVTSNWKLKVTAGVLLGLTALSHYIPIIFTSALVFFTVLFELIYLTKKKNFLDAVKKLIAKYLIPFIIGVAIAMIFFGPLIVKYHYATLNPTQEYSQFNINNERLGYVLKQFFTYCFPIALNKRAIVSTIALLGILLCFTNFKREENRFTLFWFFGALLATSHYLITEPWLNFYVVPSHVSNAYIIPSRVLVIFGVKSIYLWLKRFDKRMLKFIAIAFCILLVLPGYPGIPDMYNRYTNDMWVKVGKNLDPRTQGMLDAGEWIISNTDNDDIFVGNEESMFAINAVSGRKAVAVRRTHASPHVDIDKRYADTMVIMYGKDPQKVKELLEKYNVRYFFIDQMLYQGNMVTRLKYDTYLEENGVEFTTGDVKYDPAYSEGITYPSVIVAPQEITLMNYTKQVKVFMTGQQPIAELREIDWAAFDKIDAQKESVSIEGNQ